MEINSFNPSRLKVDESFGFFKKVESLTKLLTLEADQVSVQAFTTALLAFDNVLQQNVKNTQTAMVAQADKETDTIWRYFRAHVKALCNYPESYNASIAQKTYAIFEKFGDLSRMGYSQEYGSLFNLLQELHAISEEDQASILTHVYTNALQSAYDTFIAAQEAQTLEAADYQKGAIAENFEATSEAYAALVKRVNACILINGETDYKDFVTQMNVIIAHES